MRYRVTSWICLVVALCASAGRLGAQIRAVALTLPASTRAAAMGDAFGISLVDSDAVFYNAAFNDRLRGAGVSLARYGENTAYYTMSAGTDWLGGAIGIGVQALDYQHAGASLLLFGGGGQCCSMAAERVISLVYGRRIKGLRLAFTAKYFEHRVHSEERSVALGDVAT